MKKNFKFYILGWTGLLGLFNLLTFIIPAWPAFEKFTTSFWIGYILITVMFIGQLICSCMAFKADSEQKLFYNISLIKTSYTGLVVSFIVGGLFMIITPLP